MSQEPNIVVEPAIAEALAKATPPVVEAKPPKLDEIKLPVDDSIDAKYRGKSAADLIKMHEEAQALIGRQSQEVGTWRSVVADLSTAATRQAPPTPAQEAALKITSDELLTDPAAAISKVVERALGKAMKPIEERQSLDQREAELQALNRDFPGFAKIGDDPEFHNWAQSAAGRRADAEAVAKGNTSAARRLLEAWSDRQELLKATKQTTDGGKPQGVEGAKAGVTEPGGGRSAPTGEIMDRNDIVNMIINDPDKYNGAAFQVKLMQAAKEGRIR
jgi:hypothetical protein